MNTKYCSDCKENKLCSEFFKNKTRPGGYQGMCKKCEREKKKIYYENNKEELAAKAKIYTANNSTVIRERRKEHRENNKEVIKQRKKEYYEHNKDIISLRKKEDYKINKEKILERNKKYYENNKQNHLERCNAYSKKRYHTDETFRLEIICRKRIQHAIKSNKKSAKTLDLLGCSIEFFKDWLEYNFYDNMSWNNHGEFWHVDHVRPCASFDLKDPEQQKLCFNWKNCQPLRADKNMSKNDRRDIFVELLQELKLKIYLSKICDL